MRIPKLLILVSLLLLGVAQTANASQQRLNASASAIAGKPVTVKCFTSDDAWNTMAVASGYTGNTVLGLSIPGGNVNNISPGVCQTVATADIIGVGKIPLRQMGEAMDTLSHEANLSHLAALDTVDPQAEACAQETEALVAHIVFNVRYHTSEMRKLVAASLSFSAVEQEILGTTTCR